jgi:hypothetical protein
MLSDLIQIIFTAILFILFIPGIIFREPKNVLFTLIHAIIFAMIISFMIEQDFIEGACSRRISNTCTREEDVGKCSNDRKTTCSNKTIGTGSDYGWIENP